MVTPDAAPKQTAVPVSGAGEGAAPEASLFAGKKYTIQMVTYTSRKLAEEAVEKLAKKGRRAFIVPSGKFMQVCVEAFESRDQASMILREFKSSRLVPPDAYVRPIPAGMA